MSEKITESEFLEQFAEAIGCEAEGFAMHTPFKEEETFDSVAVLSIIVLMDSLGKTLQGHEVRSHNTPGDLWKLV